MCGYEGAFYDAADVCVSTPDRACGVRAGCAHMSGQIFFVFWRGHRPLETRLRDLDVLAIN